MKAGNKGGAQAANSTECVKVTVRCRPMNKKELNEGKFHYFKFKIPFFVMEIKFYIGRKPIVDVDS